MQAATVSSPAPALSPLEGLFQEHHRRILHAAYRVTGNSTDAEDALQTVFLRMLRKNQTPGPSETLGPYLYRAAVNAALDILRSRGRARAVPLDDAPHSSEQDPRPGPEQRHQGLEVREALRQAIANLSPRAGEIFALRFIEGYSNKEIAELLGTSQTAIGVSLHRSRNQLRQDLGVFVGEGS